MKTNDIASKLVAKLFPKIEIREDAETVLEISRKTGISRRAVSERINLALANGEVTKHYKHVNGRLVAAYIAK